MLLFGFSSGLPLLATGGTLQAWMTEAGVSLKQIGLFALVGLPYTIKFLWSPIFDRYTLPFLGRRRGWLLVTQIAVTLALASFAYVNLNANPLLVAVCALAVTFASASQDIVLDAYRRDLLSDRELGLGASFFVNGYRIGMLVAGAVALWLADQPSWNWHEVYLFLAAVMLGTGIVTLLASEPPNSHGQPKTLKAAVIEPLVDFFSRRGALVILAFIVLYKLGDSMASALSTPFFLQLGFTKTDLAYVAKTFGLGATIVGGLLGGTLLLKITLPRALWWFGILQGIAVLSMVALVHLPQVWWWLAACIALDNITSGMGTAAFVAFMGSLCNRRFSATQYALLSSLMGVPRVLFGSTTGVIAEGLGWSGFFVFCTVAAIPGLLVLVWLARRGVFEPQQSSPAFG